MIPNDGYLTKRGNVRVAVTFISFDTTGSALFDRHLLAIKQHIEQDGLTVAESIGLLSTWSDVIADATQQGKIDAFLAGRTMRIMFEWRCQLEDAIRERAA
jgi:hypothetical protein